MDKASVTRSRVQLTSASERAHSAAMAPLRMTARSSEACDLAKAEYRVIEMQIEALQEQLADAAGSLKYAIMAKINRLMREAEELQHQFSECGDLSSGLF